MMMILSCDKLDFIDGHKDLFQIAIRDQMTVIALSKIMIEGLHSIMAIIRKKCERVMDNENNG